MPEKKKQKPVVKPRLYERIAAFCEMPEEMTLVIPVFVIRGSREIEVSGCRSILEYETGRIVLSTSEGRFAVEGSGLSLSDFQGDTLIIRGVLSRVSFGGGEEAAEC